MPANPTYRLRIAILCNGLTFEAWEAECIRQVLRLAYVEPVLLITENTDDRKPRSFIQKVLQYPYRRLLWRLYDKRIKRISARAATDLSDVLGKVPLLSCKVELKGKYSQYFSAGDIETIRNYGPDIILRFGFNIIRGEILTLAPYGVWSFHHADEQRIRGGPGGFWEIMKNYPETGAILQRLTHQLDAGIILRKGHFGTIRHSYAANLDQLLWGTTSWMKQVCIDIHHQRAEYFSDKPVQTKAPIYTYATNAQMLVFRMRLLGKKFHFHWTELFRPDDWNVGIVRQPLASLTSGPMSAQVEWLPAGSAFKADPFGFIAEGKEHILYEKYDYATGYGIIAQWSEGKESTLLDTGSHLSFPFVLQLNAETLVIPEANNSKRATCYTYRGGALHDPRTLLDFPAVDANLVFFRDRWWLFCTREDDGPNHNLYIYYASTPGAEWTAHANNPVKCDIHSARPAGAPFVKDGRLYRPGQDCAPEYGSAVVIHEVLELSEATFREAAVNRLVPNPAWKLNKGMHHVAPLGDEAFLFDARSYRYNSANFKRVLKRKFSRLTGTK